MRFLFAFILLLSIHFCKAQIPDAIKFTTYNRANGLPEDNITSITQDSRGFIWIGSEEGLFRFDGLHFKSWYANPSDSTRFTNNSIRVIGEYKPGLLLFSSNYELWQIHINSHKIEPVKNFENKAIVSIEKVNNNLWCATTSDSLFLTNDKLEIISSQSLKEYFPVSTPVCFSLNAPYILIYSQNPNIFCLFDYEKKQFVKLNIDNSKLDGRTKFLTPQAYDSSRKRLFLSAYFDGNYYCDLTIPATKNYIPVAISEQPDGAIRKSYLISENKILQCGENGLYISDVNNTGSSTQKKLLNETILNIFRATDGDFWLSTIKGIIRFNLRLPVVGSWKTTVAADSDDEFKSILKGSDGNIYFLTQRNSLSQFNPSTKNIKRLESTLGYCWSAMADNDEIIATGGGSKIVTYNTTTGKLTNPQYLRPFYSENTDVVTLAFKATNGDKWFSCNGSGGLIRNPASTAQYIQYSKLLNPPSFSHNYLHCAAEDEDGNIWFAYNRSASLLKWSHKKQSFEEHLVKDLIPGYEINNGIANLHTDAIGNLWIALDGAGLVRYNLINKTGDYYDINKGLPTDAVYSMCSDANNRIWLATRKGLCCYLPEKDKVIIFTAYDGFPEDNFEGNSLYYDKEKNILYAGARHSASFFNPDSLLSNTLSNKPSVYIDEVFVNGKSFYFANEKNIYLKTKENNIEFNFAAPDFNRNNQLVFQYLLNGASNDWVDLGDKRTVTFNSLPHGKYTLSVRCKYKGTENWQETAYPFTFTIKTPLSKTVWFRLLMLALAAMLVWLIIRNYYLRKLEKQKAILEKKQAIEKERTRIATDMHDDFGASLSRIKFISEKMQLTQNENAELKTDLTKISDYSDEMAEKMNEIVWALNQRYDSCADLTSFCRSYAFEFLQDKNIKLNFSTGDIPEKKIQGEVRRNIFLVMKEALHNITKHSNATEASISFLFGNEIQMSLSDNGKGFDNNSIRPFANGLENMKKRMADINGTITISGNKGTSIQLSVPI